MPIFVGLAEFKKPESNSPLYRQKMSKMGKVNMCMQCWWISCRSAWLEVCHFLSETRLVRVVSRSRVCPRRPQISSESCYAVRFSGPTVSYWGMTQGFAATENDWESVQILCSGKLKPDWTNEQLGIGSLISCKLWLLALGHTSMVLF